MKKIIIIAAGTVVLLGAAIGGTVAYFTLGQHKETAAHPAPPPPKPIYFAALNDLVVSVPADSNDPTSAYIQITLQFSTFDQNAVTTFTNLQPIIKAQIINLLMAQTAKSLTDPSTHDALSKHCLDIANQVLNTSANYTPPNPFTAAYITNLVEQN
ncbi:flagellar basal body-associated protein FliL [Acidocella sp. KAb 2-4]|uniref:flagellar basal body-associated FliL family protein n=1 Tax=Acidocella sp. KAb 2-4 TaxID=2885158 RepID=UPI001D081465|nr:flagellar basal body-associated FliL family protein [Acidocella sp. KAb 2-4]MCB5945814.1 flagellar basal body-associated FliL family protein [Acidocella sp. KAb 2-4]